MQLFNYKADAPGGVRLGIKGTHGVIDVAAAADALGEGAAPVSMAALYAGGPDALAALHALAAAADRPEAPWLHREETLTVAPCVVQPEKILCVGLNYRRHARESGLDVPTVPVLFSKFNNALAAHGEDIPLLQNAYGFDYEVELGVVIGRTARDVSVDDALGHVLGYCTVNDLSVRDLQGRTSQWLLGKTPDKFMPVGPYLVTADAVPDPQDLWLRCWVNGGLRQDSHTSDMVFSVAEVISYASQYMTLKPGDLISTGTPEGVILGMADKVWLQGGDEVAVEVQGLGRLVNRMKNGVGRGE